MKQAAIYLRVSSIGQVGRAESAEGFSIEAQREACIRKARELEAVVDEEYVDAAESAKTANRPQLNALLARLESSRDLDLVIVHKIDRLARSRADDVAIVAAIRAGGARLVSVTENIDETPTGTLLHGIMASVAEFYSRNLATEILKGTVQKAKDGGTPTRTPLGYLNVQRFDNGHEIRTVEIDPDRADLVQWAFAAYASGSYSLTTVCEELEAKGLRTKGTRSRPGVPLGTSALARMLRQRYYIGFVTYRGVEYEGKHPRLISPELFTRVGAVLEAHTNSGQKDRKHWHYLKGVVFCARCSRRLIFTKARGRGGVYEYFLCSGRHNDKNGCPLPHLPVSKVEDAVTQYYGRTVRLPTERLADVRDDLEAALRGVVSAKRSSSIRVDREVERLERERRKLLELHYADNIPADLFGEEQARIAKALAVVRSQVGAAALDEERVVKSLDDALAMAEDAEKLYEMADPHTRRQLNETFFEKLFVNEGEVTAAELTDTYGALLRDELAEKLGEFADERRKSPDRNPRTLRAWGSIEPLIVETPGIEPGSADE